VSRVWLGMNQGDTDFLHNLLTRLVAANDAYRKSEYRGQIMRFSEDFVRGREVMSDEDVKNRIKQILEDRQAAFMSRRMPDVETATNAMIALVRELTRPVIVRRRMQTPPPEPPAPPPSSRPGWEL